MQSRRLQGGPRGGNDRNVETYLSAIGGRNDERPFEPDESAVGQLRIIRRRECRRHGGRPAASGRGYPQSRGSGRKFDAVDLAEYRLRFRIGNLHVLRAVMVSALDRDFDPADGAPERCRDGQVRTADRMDRVGVRSRAYINFKPNREIGNDALVVENLTKTIDGVKVLDNISFLMKPTDKIAFVGPNTLAATTLFKILSGEMEPDSGSYKWGVTTTQSYFPKDNTKDFSQDETIVEWLTQYSEDKDATFVRGFLGRMLFSGEDALKKVGVLSGGEKVRCMLSKLMISGANILLLDEPTNHLDMESITALNEALKDFTGALLFTSQDHQFVQTTANRIMEITPNGLIDKECTYDEYLENDEAARKRQIVEIEEDDE